LEWVLIKAEISANVALTCSYFVILQIVIPECQTTSVFWAGMTAFYRLRWRLLKL